MTKLAVTLTGSQVPLSTGILFAAVALSVIDNSGAPAQLLDANGLPLLDSNGLPETVALLTGAESPPWSANFQGLTGTNEASFSAQPLDTTGANLGTVFTGTESGTGGQPGTFFQPSGGTISVTG